MQAPYRIIKRWRRYVERGDWDGIPKWTRGIYVLYKADGDERNVVYIGVAGVGKNGGGGIIGRLKAHDRKMKMSAWNRYSVFEVHDNVIREDILELEALLLGIFRHDRRVRLANKQTSAKKLYELRKLRQWREK